MIEKKKVTQITVKMRILKLLRNRTKGLTSDEIALKGNMNHNTVRKELGKLRVSHLYAHKDSKTNRLRYSMIPF